MERCEDAETMVYCKLPSPFPSSLLNEANEPQMFFGIIILVLLITLGLFNSTNLPTGMNADVWIYNNMWGREEFSVCSGPLGPGGLRGSILGWTDGIFQGRASTYFG